MIIPLARIRGIVALLLPAVALLGAAQAAARTEIHPYIEAQQVFSADLSGHDQDAVTYTGIAAGIDMTLDGRNVQGQIDYRYDHYFSWSHRYRDGDVHNGLASIAYQPAQTVTIQASGIATRARGAFGGPSAGLIIGDLNNTTQIYAIDVGPRYSDHFGDLNMSASYDFGWTKSDDGQGGFDLGPGQPVLQNNFTQTSHTVQASAGMRPGGAGLPIGWSVSGGYIRDDIHFLDARYEDKFGRVDLTYPVTPSLALTGGVGYEKGQASQAAILIDADGNAVIDAHRHLQPDHDKPRQLSYDQDGLIWDVGVIWRPSSRTFVEIHGGHRYGETVYFGRAEHRLSPDSSIEVVAYDDVQSFGRQLTGGIGSLPTSFLSTTSSISSPIAFCVFGAKGGNGACLPALSLVSSNFYRSRGVYADWSGSYGLWSYGFGLSYDWRRYLAPSGADGNVFTFSGVRQESVTGNAVVSRRLSPVSSVRGMVLAAWNKGDEQFFDDSSFWTYGAELSYDRRFSRRLTGTASVSVSSGSGSGSGSSTDVIGTGLIALRYTL
jgi:hypothetical protein